MIMGLDRKFSTTLLSRVEDAGLNASAPPQQRWLDGWMLRLSPGKAKRARCINAVADGRLTLDERLDLARSAFAEAGLPLILRITPFSRPDDLDAQLALRGFHSLDDTRVMVYPSLDRIMAPSSPDNVKMVSLPHDAFAELVGALRESPVGQRRAHAERLSSAPVPYRGFALMKSEQALACGQFASENELTGLYDVFTAPAARGAGWATLLCRSVLAVARREGARVGYLQVEADNAPARAIYRRLGFEDAYAYHYRSDDPAVR